jgi:hypothetical protein
MELHASFDLVSESSQKRSTVGRSTQTYVLQGLLVSLNDGLDTLDLGLLTITIDREAEISLASRAWHVLNDTTETKNWEVFVIIVGLQD